MTTTRFLMLMSFLALPAVLIFYMVSNKTEPTVSKMVEIFSRPTLTNGELYCKQERIKYKLILSRYLWVMQVTLDCFKEKAVRIE